MPILESRVLNSSPEFRENLAHMQRLEADLRRRLDEARAGGGEEAVRRQREQGKLLARERLSVAAVGPSEKRVVKAVETVCPDLVSAEAA